MKIDFYTKLNEAFRNQLKKRLDERFGDCNFDTSWNIFPQSLQITWDEKVSLKKKKEIRQFINWYSEGYADCMMLASEK